MSLKNILQQWNKFHTESTYMTQQNQVLQETNNISTIAALENMGW